MVKLGIGIYFTKTPYTPISDSQYMMINNMGGEAVGLQITNKLVKILPWILSHYNGELKHKELVTHKDILNAIETIYR